MKGAAVLIALALGAVSSSAAQSVAPDTVTVGERFTVTVSLPRQASWLELLPPADTGRVHMVARTRGGMSGNGVVPATATLVAWHTGPADSVQTLARVRLGNGEQNTVTLSLPLPAVRSVLSSDPSRQVPRGAKDVWGPGRDWRAIAIIALLAMVVLGLLARLIARRRHRGLPAGTPREQALAQLAQAEKTGLLEAGDWREFYTLVADALRGYAAAIDARWSDDLTSAELVWKMREHGVSPAHIAMLAALLRSADLTKFARHRRTAEEARRDLASARRWVESFPPSGDGVETAPREAAA